MITARELLNELRAKGIAFQYEDGKLRYAGPKGILTAEHLGRLKEMRDELIEIIIQDNSSAPGSISRISRDRDLEVSYAQQQLWFLGQLTGPNHVYNLSLAIKLRGKLNVNALKRAANALLERHESLRTSFEERNSRPVMVVHAKTTLPFRIEDISDISKDKTAGECDRIIMDEATTFFDLSRAPLFRGMLLVLGNDEYIFLITCHHIISDGWSIAVIINDLAHLYNKELDDNLPSLPPHRIQYADFAAWQRELFSKDMIEEEVKYWKTKLEAVPSISSMPVDKPRPSVQSFAGDTVSLSISPDLTARLQENARKLRTTLNVLLTAAFGFTLSRYSGQNDIILGIALANRVRKELEPLVGMFVNTLPLRLDFSGTCPFSEYVSRTSLASFELLKHFQIPFELLVGELKIPRELSHQAIFQTAFTLLPPMGKPPEFTNLSAEWMQNRSNISKLDLSLYVEETDNYLTCLLEYSTALYDKKSVERWMGSLVNLLKAIAEDPNLIFDESDLISTDDRNLLAAWGEGKQKKIPDISFLESFKKHVAKNPNAIAIVGEKTTLNYAQLDELSDRIAEVLCELNDEVYIGICMKRSTEAIASMLAVWKSGAAYLPMDPSLPLERLKLIIENAKLKTVMVGGKSSPLSEVIPDLKVFNIDDILNKSTVAKNFFSPKIIYSPDLPAYIIYTSGSTGRPKGVVIRHKSMKNTLNWYFNEFGISENDIVSQIASFTFDASIPEIWSALYSGARLLLVPDDIMIDPRELHDWIVKENITIHFSPTPLAEELLKLDWGMNHNLRILYTGGDILRVRPSSTFFFKTINVYGPTENTVISTSSLVLPDRDGLPDIGKPISNVTCHILKQNGNKKVPVPPGVFGELYVGGDNLALGYLNNPELTAQSFFYWSPESYFCGKDQPSAKRIYKTGDIVRFLNDGNLEMKGRIDNQVKIRGYRIELGDIESALKRHPQIKDAIVMSHGKTSLDKHLIAYIKTEDGSQLSKDKIISHLKGVLPAYMLPARIISTNDFPLMASGKIDRKALFALYQNKAESKKTIPLKNELMKLICSIWEEVLGLPNPGIEDNFFDIGGSSLLLIKVRNLLQRHGYKIEVMDLFRYPTISALSNILQGDKKETISHVGRPANDKRGKNIAVIGMAGRFPGAENTDDFWKNLIAGKESITFFSKEELLAAGVPEKIVLNPNYVPANGILKDVDMFDADFFSVPPSEARMIDPQQRLLLETAWHTFENAGWDPTSYKKRVGVFLGTSLTSYFINNILGSIAGLPESKAFAALIANGRDFAATRIAYKLNLHGPAINVSTACSTSLTAVHLAVQALMDGHCEMALAGGATVHPQQVDGYIYEEGAILSPDGHCRAFDANAKGTVGGNGVALVLLKPLDKAIRDSDNIYAVIKGTAINNDGGDKIGFTAPSINGQAEVISMAQKDAGVQPESISYIECHGTGTVLGDSIEISALREVFENNSGERSCALGSVKTNFGHLDSAAGIAGLLKTTLSLYHGIIPKTLHFQKPNEQLSSLKGPFYINNSTQAWQTSALPRRAGVSSFGVGGTNVHIILEEPPLPVVKTSGRSSQIIPLSAKNEKALRKISLSIAEFLENNNGLDLADIAFTLARGRKTFNVRRAFVTGNSSDFIKKLRSDYQLDKNPSRELAFMFTGQGSQHLGMGKELLKESVFCDTVKECADILKPYLNLDIRDVIWADSSSAEANSKLTSTRFAQPALFIFDYALAKQWMHWGIIPKAMIGHSIGEWVAACLSGVFSLDDSLRLVALRGELMDKQAPGKMLAVSVPENEISNYLSPGLSLAAVNSPRQCVISGPENEIAELAELLNSNNISNSKINTSHAFHSDMMTPVLKPFAKAVAEVKRSAHKIPFISNITGKWITDEEAVSPEYWAHHLRETVRFTEGLTTLLEKENICLLEIGPKKVLANLVLQTPEYKNGHLVFSSMSDFPNDPAFENLGKTIAGIWAAGFDIDWDAFYEHEKRQRIPLPTYPFERQHYWIEAVRENIFTQKPEDMNSSDSNFKALTGKMSNHEAALWQTLPIKLVADSPEFIALVNKLCSAYVLRMIVRALPGIGPGDRFDIDMLIKSLNPPSSLHRLLEAHLRMIEEDGLVRRDEKSYTLLVNPSDCESPETLLEKGKISFPDFEKDLLFINHCAGQNEAVLKREFNALEVLFSTDKYSLFESKRLDEHNIYIQLARHLLEQMLLNNKSDRLRVLEVGGGSGMLTEAMLSVLPKGNIEYMFTDISSNFTNAAQKRFNNSNMKYGILDISRDPIGQGYTAGSFDLILGLNVIHATSDLRHTLSNLRVLMSAGSIFCIIEEVRPRRWNDMCWGLTDGWWHYTDIDLRQHSPLISILDWKELLRSSGFNQSTAFPESSPLISRSDCGMILAVKGEESVVINTAKTNSQYSTNKIVEEPGNDIERYIVQAMSEVLGLASLGRRDNFFALGGDSLLALQLCSKLKRDYDIELPHAAVLQSSTPAQLATKIITKEDSAPNRNYLSGSGGIIRLRKGNSEGPSLFLIHPVGGGVLCYRDLISFLTTARSVYGLQSFGLTDSTPPLKDIDIMAKYYVEAICDLPFSKAGRVLAGHSFGGLVAFEMARLLDKRGEKPLMTVLIDTPGPGHMPRVFQHDDEFLAYMLVEEDPDKEWDNNLRLIKSLPEKQRLGYVLKRIKQSLPDPDQVKDEVFLRYLDVTRFNINAMDTYKPEKWDINILFFKAQEMNKFSALTPEKAWADMAKGGIEVINVPGNHISMLSKPNVAVIGNELEKRMNAIQSGKSI